MIDPAATYASIGAALACGFLIGLEREQAEAAEQAAASADPQGPDEPGSFGGVRTFTLLSLVGGLAVVAGQSLGAWVVGVTFAAVALMVGLRAVSGRFVGCAFRIALGAGPDPEA